MEEIHKANTKISLGQTRMTKRKRTAIMAMRVLMTGDEVKMARQLVKRKRRSVRERRRTKIREDN